MTSPPGLHLLLDRALTLAARTHLLTARHRTALDRACPSVLEQLRQWADALPRHLADAAGSPHPLLRRAAFRHADQACTELILQLRLASALEAVDGEARRLVEDARTIRTITRALGSRDVGAPAA